MTANCRLPRETITRREQMPVVFGDHIAPGSHHASMSAESAPVSRPASRGPSVISRVTVSSPQGRGSSASGSKKMGSSGPGSRPNLSRKRRAWLSLISRSCSCCAESAGLPMDSAAIVAMDPLGEPGSWDRSTTSRA
jgi:hypothetical protein